MPRSSVREMGAHSCPPISCTREGAWSTDHLHTIAAELVSCLRSSPEAFDVVASSDTLVYFGDLREVLAAARTSLRPRGRLLFTLEHAINEADGPGGHHIHSHRR